MSEIAPDVSGWSRGKFLLIVIGIFALQAALVLLLAERKAPLIPPGPPAFSLTVWPVSLSSEALARRVFAVDPTVFAAPSPHAFAEQAWAHLPPREVETPQRAEAPAFLDYETIAMAHRPETAPPATRQIPFEVATQMGSHDDTNLGVDPPRLAREDSFFRLEGEMDARQISPVSKLLAWTNNTLLTNSTVQFSVNRSGLVDSAELLSGCGLAEADQNAVSTVLSLRFSPSAPSSGLATFYWKTVAPPQTNALAPAPADASP